MLYDFILPNNGITMLDGKHKRCVYMRSIKAIGGRLAANVATIRRAPPVMRLDGRSTPWHQLAAPGVVKPPAQELCAFCLGHLAPGGEVQWYHHETRKMTQVTPAQL